MQNLMVKAGFLSQYGGDGCCCKCAQLWLTCRPVNMEFVRAEVSPKTQKQQECFGKKQDYKRRRPLECLCVSNARAFFPLSQVTGQVSAPMLAQARRANLSGRSGEPLVKSSP